MGLLEGFRPVSDPQLAQIRSNVFITSGQKATATLYIVLGLILVFSLLYIVSGLSSGFFVPMYCFRIDLIFSIYILFQD